MTDCWQSYHNRWNYECRKYALIITSGEHLIGNSFIFQHDNNHKHTVSTAKEYLDRKTYNRKLSVMDCPPQSPDFSVIEAVWDHHNTE